MDIRVTGKYATFVADNLLCYTQIFVKLLTRFQRMDLSIYKNVLMIYRMVKVFSQTNLMDVIKCNENLMSIGHPNNSSNSTRSFSQNDSAAFISTHGNSSSSFTYSTDSSYACVSSPEVKNMVRDLMKKVFHAKLKTQKHIEESAVKLHKKFGIFESIVKWFPFLLSVSDLDSSITQEENRQIPEILDYVVNSFSSMFEVSDSAWIHPIFLSNF